MIEEQALVLSELEGKVRVRVQRQSACDSCQLKSGCGQSTLTKLSSNMCIEFDVPNKMNAESGDMVLIAIPEQGLITASLMVYLFPLLCMLTAAIMAKNIFNGSDLYIAMCGLFALFIGFVCARFYGQKHSEDVRFLPEIVRIVSHQS